MAAKSAVSTFTNGHDSSRDCEPDEERGTVVVVGGSVVDAAVLAAAVGPAARAVAVMAVTLWPPSGPR